MYENIIILILIFVLLYLTTNNLKENFQDSFGFQAVAPDKMISPYTLTPKNIDNISDTVLHELERDESLHSGIAGFIHPSFIADHIDTTTLRGQKGSQGQKGDTGRASGMRSHEITFSPRFNTLRKYGDGFDYDTWNNSTPLTNGELHKNFIGRFHTTDVVEIYIVFSNDMSSISRHRTSYFKVTKEMGSISLVNMPELRIPQVYSVECDIPITLYFRNSDDGEIGMSDDVYELFFQTHVTPRMSNTMEQNMIKHTIFVRTSNNPDGHELERVQPSQTDERIFPCIKVFTTKNYKGKGTGDGDSPLKHDGGDTTVGNLDIKRGIHVQSLCIKDKCLNGNDIEKIKELSRP